MEVLVENRFTLTKNLFYEGMRRVIADGSGKLIRWTLLFLGAAWLVLAGMTLWQRQNLGYVVIEFVVLSLVALWLGVYLPRNKTKRAYRAMQAQSGIDTERVARFYADRLELKAAERERTVLYTEIEKILPAKRLLVLMTEDKTGILLARDGFTVGDESTIRALIQQAKLKALEES